MNEAGILNLFDGVLLHDGWASLPALHQRRPSALQRPLCREPVYAELGPGALGYLSTANKHGIGALKALNHLYTGTIWTPAYPPQAPGT